MAERIPNLADLADLRHDVALANRIVHAAGLVNAYGHISARIGTSNRFIFPTRKSPALAHEDRLLILDTDGNQVEGEGTPNTEFWIHARIYAARPDVGAVAHVHSPSCIALGQIGQTVRPMHNAAGGFSDGVPVFEKIGLIRSRELGDEVAAALGNHIGMLLRGHGANIAESNVRKAAVMAIFLEEAAELQLQALAAAGGDPERLHYYTAEEMALIREQQYSSGPLDRAWEYFSALAQGEVD